MFSRATALLALLTTLAGHASAGFVSTNGNAFELDGKPFYFLGTNSYWVAQTPWTPEQHHTIFTEMADNNITVCRTMAFNDVTSVPAWGSYYQLWTNGTAVVNEGERGLAFFDQVVAAAKATGVKLVVALVNNWNAFGGMDVYTKQLGGQFHDEFYTSETVKTAYKAYIKAFVTRYKDEDAIMSWQLANENRCYGSGDLPTSGTCTPATITAWLSEMSAFIKSLDSNHLVAAGDEGFMNTDPNTNLYNGAEGVDFDANLQISTLDYGTYHMYPDHWGVAEGSYKEWGLQWIQDHVASGNKAGKPVVAEEYGLLNKDAATYQAWSDRVLSLKSNMQYWQFGVSSLGTHDDGFTIYTTDALFQSTIAPAAAQFKAAI